MGEKIHSSEMKVKRMTTEHNLFDPEERKRVECSDCYSMTLEEKEGISEAVDQLGPPHIWHLDPNKSPGIAFTRSIGDTIAHELGVISHPDVFNYKLNEQGHQIIIICSDGVTEWLDEKTCIKIVSKYTETNTAAEALIKEARRLWLQHTDYVDDISAIIIMCKPKTYGKIKDKESTVINQMGVRAIFWTLVAGSSSGFLGALCAIQGPPLMPYFLHPPYPLQFRKKKQFRVL